MPALADMTARQIEAYKAKLEKRNRALGDEMIATGRGYEKPNETRTKDDPLARQVNAAADDWQDLMREIEQRKRYHGTLKPIARSKWT